MILSFCGVALRAGVVCRALVGLCLGAGSLMAAEPVHRVQVRLVGESERPVAARVSILDGQDRPVAPAGATVRKTSKGVTYFYADGELDVALPDGRSRWEFSGGLETVPQVLLVDVRAAANLEVRLRPWISMASRGWYSGDSHVHLHTGGPLSVTVADALVAARAEGVNYVNLCVSNNEGDDIRDADLITGQAHSLSTPQHLLVFGEEMRSSIYGHMQFFGIRKLVEPQYTGFDNTPQHLDYPANQVMAAEAVRQGGLVTYGHPMFADQPDPFGNDPTAGSAAARELPVDAISGAVQAVDLMCYNSDEPLSAELWYRLLNCGIRLSACVGTDALLDRSTDPLGGDRVYVKVDGELTMQRWLEGLKRGRSFVTNGPILQLEVNATGIGETCQLATPGMVRVAAMVESYVPVERVEVILNGQAVFSPVIEETSATDGIRIRRFEVDVPVTRSSWVAMRVGGSDHRHVFDGPAWAHTSPIYIQVGDQPIRHQQDAAYFVDWIDRLLRVVATRDRYANADDRQRVETLFRTAQAKFRRMADGPDPP